VILVAEVAMLVPGCSYRLYSVEHPSLGKGGNVFFFSTNTCEKSEPGNLRLWADDAEASEFLERPDVIQRYVAVEDS
jgi:hypothetical protein